MIDPKRLQDLHDREHALRAPTDTLNMRLREVEDALRHLNLGMTATIELEPMHWLHWGKLGGNWCLFLGEGPLETATRRVRALAARNMERLVDELCTRLDAEIVNVKVATEHVEYVLEAFRQAGCLPETPTKTK